VQAQVQPFQRDSVRGKLAQLMAANPLLACSADSSSAIARALEAAVHSPRASRGQYTSAATALAAAVRKAAGWWQLQAWAEKAPAAEAAGRAAFIDAAVAAAESSAAAAAASGAGAGAGQAAARALKELLALQPLRVDAALLASTGAGKRVRALKKCPGQLGEAAGRVVEGWKAQVAAARKKPPAGAADGNE
jgi:hypothetical protein